MKKYLQLLSLLVITACNSSEKKESANNITHFYAPEEGTVIAADSIPITEDTLNDFYYSIKLTSTFMSEDGSYRMNVAYGHNDAQSDIVYPKLTGKVTPAVQLDKSIPYTYNIGFYLDGSDEFKDYARVSARKGYSGKQEIELKYIKTYYVDTVAKTK